jgi:hypothetical protein
MKKQLVLILLIFQTMLSSGETINSLERVQVQPDSNGAQFVLKDSGIPFYTTGFNYIRLRTADGTPGGDHSTFEAETNFTKADYDPVRAEKMFSVLSKAGYNTVRVFITGRKTYNPGIGGDYKSTKGLYEPYMENVLDFLRRATRHKIRVLPTFGDGRLPMNAYFMDQFKQFGQNRTVLILTGKGVDARVEYISSFLSYIKEEEPAVLPTLLGLQCQNEAHLSAKEWPFTEKKGEFKAANGKSYIQGSARP